MPRTQHEPRPEEIVIEIDQERKVTPVDNFGNEDPNAEEMVVGNSNVYFFPIDNSLRSVFIPYRSGPAYPAVINQLQRIPGQRVHYDPKKNIGTITDALGDVANEGILKKINDVNRRSDPPRGENGPHRIQEHQLRTSAAQHTWLYWMARAVEDGTAKLVQGDLKSATFYQNKGDVRMPEYHLLPNQSAQNYQPEAVGAA